MYTILSRRSHARRKPFKALVAAILGPVNCGGEAPGPIASAGPTTEGVPSHAAGDAAEQDCRLPNNVTIEDVSAVPLFSALPAADRERLARTSADLHLGSGEFAVPEGGERALFAVLTGKIEVVKTIDGIERTLGWRLPGTIFGEVPIALGTPFPGGYRAAEPSRVMRIEVQQYYAIAAVSKEVSQKVSALARERMGGLQSIAAEPQKPRVTSGRRRWDTACGDLRRFLARNQISFNWLSPDAPEVARLFRRRPADDRLARWCGSRTER